MANNNQIQFKETEIGAIPAEWDFDELKNHAEILMGQSPESLYYNESGDGALFLQGVRTFGEKYPTYDTWTTKVTKLAKAGSVLLSVRAPVGEVNIAQNDLCIGRGLMSVNGKNNEFIYQLFKAFNSYIVSKETGTVYGSVTKDDIANIKLPFPQLPEQQEIAEILSSLDDKIELNRQMNKTLESIAQSIFKRWFIDFEFPNNNGKPYKSSDGKMVDSELGNIPKEWSVEPIGSITDIAIGRTPPRKESQWFSTNPSDIKWISIRDLGHVGIYIGQSAEYLTLDAVERFNVPVIPKNSVVLSFKLTVGRVAITTEDMLSNEAIAHFKLVNNSYNLSPEFIYLFLKNYDFSQLGSTSSIATAVNSQSIKKIKVILPDKKTIDDFNNLVGSIFNQLKNTYFEINSLSNIRDSLLPRLMNGKIRVKI